MKEFIQGMYQKTHFTKRLIAVILSVIVMGFALSWLVLVDLGTDPCTSMNLAISHKLGMSIGNWQALFNSFLFIFVILWCRENIGFGTLANMFLVGYSLDFFSWLWGRVLPEGAFSSMAVRIGVLFPALLLFVLSAAVYMDVELGTAPYDAVPYIIWNALKKKASSIPFRFVRMGFDIVVVIIALIFGGKLGVVTVLMAFVLGPVIEFVGNLLQKVIEIDE